MTIRYPYQHTYDGDGRLVSLRRNDMPEPTPATGGYPQPTVGRIVHIHDAATGEGPIAAIVAGVSNGGNNVRVHIFPPDGPPARTAQSVKHLSIAGENDTYWCWPPRE